MLNVRFKNGRALGKVEEGFAAHAVATATPSSSPG